MGAVALLQDWITIRGLAASDEVVQSVRDWLDAEGYCDIAFYTEVKEYSGTDATITFQTAPAQDEALWVDMDHHTPANTSMKTTAVKWDSAGTPVARFVRWKASATGANWRLTFRINAVLKS